ncbi:concanavalin A-like lectin/glucanase domain-containing protein [Amylocystis lapponica]|nr:concanavalin A-like lectin/glucanase domain-containing protein [Amylocystis lapponica]
MRTGHALLCLAPVLIPFARAQFALKDSYTGGDFFDHWTWETGNDPTNGRVNYVDQETAINHNLSYAANNKFIMRADDFNIVPQDARGRNSIRISSNSSYNDTVTVLDLQHMPEGCSTWPAFWSLSATGPWPRGGEIDIVEGVNLNTQNLGSLHTMPSCSMAQERLQTGQTVSTNCDVNVNFNQGCGVSFPGASYGAPFNNAGGGFFVMVRTQQDGVRIWFWSRSDPTTPPAVRAPVPALLGPPKIFPDASWGAPAAAFPAGATCDYAAHFDAHQFVFDLTFCGDWAGDAYASSGCGGSCVDLVDNHPEAFQRAYWEINSLRVYTLM